MIIELPVRQSLIASAALCALLAVTPARAMERHVAGATFDTAVADALALVAQRADLSVVRIAGQSMLPYFSDDAVVVVKQIDAARLRVGMIAVYVNRFGEKIAHRVIAPVDGGWQVKGYNNDQPDSTVVNSRNLLGVVYATFHSTGRAPVAVASVKLPAIETVYAAPAK
ncbi:MAG: S24/S26 family peptidase [Opitutaceae bacterium]|nr:S24/S26 family peptidase [Opitutaceae bacterium]